MEVAHHVGERFVYAAFNLVESSYGVIEVVFDCDQCFNFKRGRESEFIDHEHVEWVRHRDKKFLAVNLDGKGFETLG